MRCLLIAGGALVLAACTSETPANQVAAAPASIPAGEYEVTTTVAQFRSTDNTTPIVRVEQGTTATSRACIGADGAPPPGMFTAQGDVCTPQNAYARNGRLSASYACTREGAPGQIMVEANGRFADDGLSGEVRTSTFLTGSGDYELRQDFTGGRVGECPAGGAAS